MGTPDYASTILKALIEDSGIEVIALFAQPDKPVGRKQILTPPHTKNFLIENSIDMQIFQPNRLRDEENIEIIKSLKPDFIVVAAYGQILPKEILDIVPCINLHASLLPAYRGASPIQSSLLNSDKFSGVTAMLMDVGLDTGDILGFRYVEVGEKNVVGLFNALAEEASKLTIDVLKNFKSLKPLKQISALASYSPKIKKDDGEIEFKNAKEIVAKFKAFYFWPEIFLASGLKLKEITLIDEEKSYSEGEIIEVKSDSIIVGCKKGSIEVFSVQPKSKKAMDVLSYLRGKRLVKGDIFN